MTSQKELRNLIARAEAKGAIVTVQLDESALSPKAARDHQRASMSSVLKGVGTHLDEPHQRG